MDILITNRGSENEICLNDGKGVFSEKFPGTRLPYPEISEEFRLFHNLYYIRDKDIYIKINEDGSEEEVIRIVDKQVSIKTLYIRKFLAFKKMHLGLFFVLDRNSKFTLEELNIDDKNIWIKKENIVAEIYWENMEKGEYKSYSRMFGKKYIGPIEIEKTGIYPFEHPLRYEEYIIGEDENGNEIRYTCAPEYDMPNIKRNPHYYKPIHFDREALAKYYSDSDKYKVTDSYLAIMGVAGIKIDNNNDETVIAFLGDLGKLPFKEQTYLKAFNIPPEGNMSETYYERNILGNWSNPVSGEFVFINKFKELNEKWMDKYEWNLFKELSKEDEFHYNSLRVPINNSQTEFDSQVLSLVKITIDSINEKEIKKLIAPLDKDIKGIAKLEKFLEEYHFTNYENFIEMLKNLQSLRAGSAHRKGKDSIKGKIYFGDDSFSNQEVFLIILHSLSDFLDYLLGNLDD